jgi:hypothetical protein
MAHLFHNEEWSHGLRDLSDLDLLLRHFDATSAFWEVLVERSRELDLTRPLYYGLHQVNVVLGTPVPMAALQASRRFAPPWPCARSWRGSGRMRFDRRIGPQRTL